ncbi:hypothetical protein JX265_006359 [Neoarthrinium moseri]|uniref:Uncharacterized protein n=1 Tax=Neoarthrinium moseri TaxID=1658444 RepID=A0A9P9WME9_9PEZI|nr:hypothetical protein JX265_006359 [Neoarthrinium moseri]
MYSTVGPLNNKNLSEALLPAAEYNALPHIHSCKLEPLKHHEAHAALLNLIAKNDLNHVFSIHLIHKHFDCPEGHVMVYEKVAGGKTPDFIVMTPREAAKTQGLRGLYFMANAEGKMIAYEYTTEPAKDLSAYEDVVADFATIANHYGVGHIFCLGAEGISSVENPQAEFEMAALSSTVVVDANSLPGINDLPYTVTDWKPAPEQQQKKTVGGTGELGGTIYPEVPGLLTLKCIESRSGKHCEHGIFGGPLVEQRQQATSIGGTGRAGDTIYPEVPGLLTLKCIESRSGKHCEHGIFGGPMVEKASPGGNGRVEGVPYVEERQSMPGMSHKIGASGVVVNPRVQVGGIPAGDDSVIHDVLYRAVAAIQAGNA